MKQNNFKNAQTHYQFILGPIKIKDGLFMGDELAAKDIEFIISNKVTHVINTVSRAIPNLWERFGIQYLSVNWTEKQQNVPFSLKKIFDKKNNAVNAIFQFVQEAMQQGESCLIHSLHGKSRACAVMVAYMMKKYQWNLDRCFEYITSKKQHLEIRDNYLSQLQQLEKRMLQTVKLSGNWNECKSEQEMILKNTYFNSKALEIPQKQQPKTQKKRIQWGEVTVITGKQTVNTTNAQMSATMTRFKQSRQKRVGNEGTKRLKSILKGQQNPIQEEESKIQQKMSATDSNFPVKKDNNFISSINGNIVHVTVNNFITTDKKPSVDNNRAHLTRPYSSDNKERMERDMKVGKFQPKKSLFTYDTSFKSPYDTKLTSKLGPTVVGKITKKKQEIKNPMMTYERPQSANIAGERRKINNRNGTGGFMDSNRKQDIMVTGKKRYPSSNPRQQLYRFK